MNHKLPLFLIQPEVLTSQQVSGKVTRLPFIDITLKTIASFIKAGTIQGHTSRSKGILQRVDARCKLLFLLYFVVIINFNSQIQTQIFLAVFLIGMYVFSHIKVVAVFKRITLLGFMFGFIIIAPAAVNIVSPGENIFTLLHFDRSHHFWIYHVPSHIYLTKEGCIVVLRFYLKVSNAIALTMLIAYTTPFNEIIRSLKMIRVPDIFLLVITLSYKFIFILAQTTEETYMAFKARWWRYNGADETKKLVAGRIIYIFRKSWIKYEEVYKAMTVRGFSGDVKVLSVNKLTWIDVIFALCFIIWGVISCYI